MPYLYRKYISITRTIGRQHCKYVEIISLNKTSNHCGLCYFIILLSHIIVWINIKKISDYVKKKSIVICPFLVLCSSRQIHLRVSIHRCTTNLKLTIFDVKIIATINSIISRLHKVMNMKSYNRNLVACIEIEYKYSS